MKKETNNLKISFMDQGVKASIRILGVSYRTKQHMEACFITG